MMLNVMEEQANRLRVEEDNEDDDYCVSVGVVVKV